MKFSIELDEIKVKNNDYIYEEGDKVDGFYLIVSGQYQI